MPLSPEQQARLNIDQLLTDAGWLIQDNANPVAGRGVAIREDVAR
jgi:type I site-specific restriction endonuclease